MYYFTLEGYGHVTMRCKKYFSMVSDVYYHIFSHETSHYVHLTHDIINYQIP